MASHLKVFSSEYAGSGSSEPGDWGTTLYRAKNRSSSSSNCSLVDSFGFVTLEPLKYRLIILSRHHGKRTLSVRNQLPTICLVAASPLRAREDFKGNQPQNGESVNSTDGK